MPRAWSRSKMEESSETNCSRRAETHMHFLSVPVRNLRNRPLRSALTVLGIAVAVGSFIALVGASRGIQHALVQGFAEQDTHIVALRRNAADLLSATVDERVGEAIRRVPGVADVAGELVTLVDVEPDQTLLATGRDPRGYLWTTASLHEGHMPGPGEPNGVVLGEAAGAALHKTLNDTIAVEGEALVITGIARYRGTLNNSGLVMPLASLQALMGLPGKVISFSIRARDPRDAPRLDALKDRLAAEFPLLAFAETADVAESVRSMQFLRSLAWAVSVIAFFMGTVIVLNTLLMSVAERAYDIGVLSALGWSPALILSMILVEGAVLTIVGSACGIAAGILALNVLAGMPPVLGFMEPDVSLTLVLQVAVAAVAMGIAGSLYPAWRAIRMDPVAALRHE
jgi:putative ABC transport system permease protein